MSFFQFSLRQNVAIICFGEKHYTLDNFCSISLFKSEILFSQMGHFKVFTEKLIGLCAFVGAYMVVLLLQILNFGLNSSLIDCFNFQRNWKKVEKRTMSKYAISNCNAEIYKF